MAASRSKADVTSSIISLLAGAVVVSCQAESGLPLDHPSHIEALAKSVLLGGAAGLRIEGEANLRAVRPITDRPVIGLIKKAVPGSDVYITATLADVEAVIASGADIVAFDGTDRPRPDRIATLAATVGRAGRISMADVSTAREGEAAIASGADIVSTTMSGYTPYSRQLEGPDFEMMSELAKAGVPFVAEGRVWTADDARRCLDLGATFVVVGSAITRPDAITRRFLRTMAETASPDIDRRSFR